METLAIHVETIPTRGFLNILIGISWHVSYNFDDSITRDTGCLKKYAHGSCFVVPRSPFKTWINPSTE